ncbi:MAG: bifunctional salicylyl-CoA 5-hydroxylase/oxidoreductase [Pseudomonadota bacterium]
MKIAFIGGGPGGLYCALLTKKRMPDCVIDVFEQNLADDTFGFGVVFSDDTLDEFLGADPESYAQVRANFAYWSDIVIEHRGHRTVVGGNGFAGCSRKTLLALLQGRCRALGVRLHFSTIIEPHMVDERLADYDLIIVAQGINSPIRAHFSEEFGVRVIEQRNKFLWLGSTRPLDAFTFFFVETEYGPICAHTYQYEAGGSTWVIETTPECWDGWGFAAMDEAESAACLESVFADQLAGHSFITNRSIWRNFPTISCTSWRHGRMVLLGDTKATAHWSIGAGTKLAMECAAALSDAIVAHDDVDSALAAYEMARRTPVEITQHNAQVSLRWFEDMPKHLDKSPYEFAFSLMSRAKALTWDNIGLRDKAFLEKTEDEFYARYEGRTGRIAADRPTPMFTPFDLRDLTIPNRVAMAPMAQYCAVDGNITDWHRTHYAARAIGGAGLIFTEMTCPTADARITTGCTGLWSDSQEADWAQLVSMIHTTTPAKVALQLGHAGRKGSTNIPQLGADLPMGEGNWPLVSASAIAYFEGRSQTPAEIDRAGMDLIRDSFVAAAVRGARAGFDMLELHCAHGYLLASFLSPLTNRRSDGYGGDAKSRMRFPLEIYEAVRAVWPGARPISVRLSCSDWAAGGLTLDDLALYAQRLKAAGVDVIHASSGQTVPWQKPVYGRMWQTPFSEFIRLTADIPTIAVGDITLPEQINTIVAAGRADLCALARPMLNDPFFVRQAAGHYGVRSSCGLPLGWPEPLSSGEYQLYRETEKANAKFIELNVKARPIRRHYQQAGSADSEG